MTTNRELPPLASPTPRRRRFLAGVAALAFAPLTTSCGGGDDDAGGPAIPSGPTDPPAPGVAGPAWWGFGRDAQHSAVSAIATQDLNRVGWMTPLDLAPQYRGSGGPLLTHYGSPVITSNNTVVLPVKTGAGGGFRIEARSGVNGGPIWSATTDYALPAHNWIPSYNLALAGDNRLYAPGAGGKLLVKADADSPSGSLQTLVFYGASTYAAAPATYDACVFINTPVTVDPLGNVFFGFVVTAANPAGLESGIARIGADGAGSWVSARVSAEDNGVAKMQTGCAPALSPDLATLYVAVNADPAAGTIQGGYLLALDSTTLAVRNRVLLIDPASRTFARVSDDSTASPTVGPDGDVYFGVLETVFGAHNGRGWLLHFDPTLATSFAPGGFGWDDTASVVATSLVPSYSGSAPYLLMVKYNDYRGVGSGNGANRVAIIDPSAIQVDPISGLPIMREVQTLLGPTFESGNSGPVVEWCINTAAVDPFTRSVLVNSEDGYLYRWDLATNAASQRIRLTSGIGESYTPTAVGADGAVYAVNNAVLFSIQR
jgi:hypothetical protein